jgi:hypothetical protein
MLQETSDWIKLSTVFNKKVLFLKSKLLFLMYIWLYSPWEDARTVCFSAPWVLELILNYSCSWEPSSGVLTQPSLYSCNVACSNHHDACCVQHGCSHLICCLNETLCIEKNGTQCSWCCNATYSFAALVMNVFSSINPHLTSSWVLQAGKTCRMPHQLGQMMRWTSQVH